MPSVFFSFYRRSRGVEFDGPFSFLNCPLYFELVETRLCRTDCKRLKLMLLLQSFWVETSRYSISISHAYQDINIVLFSGSSETLWLPVYLCSEKIRRNWTRSSVMSWLPSCWWNEIQNPNRSYCFRHFSAATRKSAVFLRIDLEGNGDFLGWQAVIIYDRVIFTLLHLWFLSLISSMNYWWRWLPCVLPPFVLNVFFVHFSTFWSSWHLLRLVIFLYLTQWNVFRQQNDHDFLCSKWSF